MQSKFKNFVEKESLLSGDDKVLVCVSGGVDSMVLLSLVGEYLGRRDRVGVAHCNFMLRGGESDGDTALVERTCESYGVECHIRYFDTKAVVRSSGDSTQMVARQLRYAWFEELAAEFGYTKIAIAHHSDDAIETFFINLMRGTGVRGLGGISVVRANIVRPLLFASRDEIEKYALQNNIEYRTDSSNMSDNYLRSRLRYDILPRFESSSRSFRTTMAHNIERLSSTGRFIEGVISHIKGDIIRDGKLDLSVLSNYPEPKFVLYEILRSYGFSGEVVDDIYGANHTGKQFYSPSHLATLNRGELLIEPRANIELEEFELLENDPRIEKVNTTTLMSLSTPENVALICADGLSFPLKYRRWESGDSFVPLGMTGQKKVSDFLIDQKVSLPDKERQGVLLSGEDIVWVVGRRIDNRYRVTERSRTVIKITL
ncbi:MAG: tRNA lysidine(34) synthetase TilS [Rikenellaceae bacterium]